MSDKKRALLLSVTGMTPQVVTETLYSMVTKEGIVPSEIHVITTTRGRNRILRDLLDSQTGQFHLFCRDYGLVGQIRFDASNIHVIEADGEGLPDIRTPDENAVAADEIIRLVREFCRDPETTLHVSLAGGRKTMGFFVGYALSLFGRAGDTLSHVLVNDPYENNRDFFYPSQTPREIFTQTGASLDASKAEVMLAAIPFVRLREGLPDSLLCGEKTYSETVAEAQARIIPPTEIQFDTEKRTVFLGGTALQLPPLLFAVYLWLSVRTKGGEGAVRPSGEAQRDVFLKTYRYVVGSGAADYDNAVRSLRHAEDFLPYFQEKRANINKRIRLTLGGVAAEPYLIKTFGKRPDTRYGIGLQAANVVLPRDFP